ncbi:Crp/Fnr family transcriptional regulator [Listeria rocourtiae]|uniref:Crp/Fnr family transcriptional regulator n=1 Tax=Listeria rocourtiae TaxID=647910 RepID=UPI0003E8AFB0|nr:Crp/Fnr family transcriptional regulator [Listeria rocourtiae]EUJ48369.1 hypothetical protein PROCOU_05463 [Listeria rocourtiae FSL F6-920]
MSIAKLYDMEAIKQDFNIEKLLPILLEEDNYPIEKEKLVLEKSDIFQIDDDANRYVFAIEKGVCSVHVGNQNVDFVGSGDFIGLHSEGDTDKLKIRMEAMTDEIIIWRFKFHDVLANIMNIQEGYLYHYNYMMQIHRIYLEKMMAMVSDKEQRVLTFLKLLAEKFGENDGEPNVFLKLPPFFTRKLITEYIGVSPMTLNKAMKKIRK